MKFLQFISILHIFFLIQSIYGHPVIPSTSNIYIATNEIQPDLTSKKNSVPKKILNRSIFVVPTIKPKCSNGVKSNQNGKCEPKVKFEENNYIKFILDKIFNYDYESSEYDENDYDQFQISDSGSTDKVQGSVRLSIPFL